MSSPNCAVHQPFAERHADGRGNALAERARGHLDTRGDTMLRMPGGARSELAEVFQLFDGEVLITKQVKTGIEQHRAVAGGQNKAVPVRPGRIGCVELEVFGEQNRGDVRHAHGHAWVAAVGFLHGVHGQDADRVGHLPLFQGVSAWRSGRRVRLGGRRRALGWGHYCDAVVVRSRPHIPPALPESMGQTKRNRAAPRARKKMQARSICLPMDWPGAHPAVQTAVIGEKNA